MDGLINTARGTELMSPSLFAASTPEMLTGRPDTAAVADDVSWATIPTNILLAELKRRQDDGQDQKPECGSRERGWYDTAAHVFALFLILVLSTLSTSTAIQKAVALQSLT